MADDDAVTGPVPLPDVQIVFLDRQWSDYEYPDHMEHKFPASDEFVSWQCFAAVEEIRRDDVERALRAVLLHHDALRTRLEKRDGRWHQHIVALDEVTPLVWIDLSGAGDEERPDAIQAVFDREVASLSVTHGPVVKCVYLIQGGQQPSLLLLFYNHVIVDWLSAQILADDFHTALGQSRLGQDIVLPPKTTSVRTWGERIEGIIESGQWEPHLRRLTEYKRSWPPVSLPTLPLDFPEGNPDEEPADEVRVHLAPAPTAALLRSAASGRGVRVLDLLQSALARTLGQWAAVPAVPMCVVLHGREQVFSDIDLSRTVGSFAMGLLEVVSATEDPRPSPLADTRLRFAQVLLNFSRSLEHAYEGDGAASYVSIYDRFNPQVSINYHGRLESVDQPGERRLLRPVAIQEWRDTRIRAVSKSLDCVVAVDRGRLLVTWKFSPRYYRRASIERLAATYLRELTVFTGPQAERDPASDPTAEAPIHR